MYVNEIGVVGVGEVLEEYDRKSYSGTEWLVYGPGSNGFGTEHRIRVNWYKDLRYNPISYSKLKSVNIIPNSAFKHIVSSKEGILELVDSNARFEKIEIEGKRIKFHTSLSVFYLKIYIYKY